ncbi:head scaffolding protein [Pseudomonas phage tf]|jgi:hypothetical protein|uniref:Scaffolding protein n=1 Tax=Pseudomonas phage tf TaxID=1114179 RepID=I2FLT6_9CAUD|nr:head scaffolding protein [Pseudomonas phage tf]CCE60820.1 scaffolding protein [Pseudomonas phage tf]
MTDQIVDVQEAADALEAMFDDDLLELVEETATDEATQDVADALEDELEDESEGESEDEEEGEEESEEESEEGDEESEEDQGDISDDTLIDITIDGEEYEVNLPELKAGYLRHEDFVKRSTELETEYSQRMAELSQKEAELVREIEATAVIATADLSKYEKIDWARLKAEDPAKYAEQFSEYMEKRQAIQNQIARRNQVQALTQKAEQLKHEAYLKTQLELARKLIPEFDDDGYRQRIFAYADSIGITKEEVQGITDARHLLLLGQAMQHQESQVRKKATIEKKVKDTKTLPPLVKPGAKKPAGSDKAKQQKALEARLAKTGSIRDAAAAFLDFV